MASRLRERSRGLWAFVLAASAAPLTYLFMMPCSLGCGACPLTGTCLLAYPLVIAVALVVKFSAWFQSSVRAILSRISGK